MAEFSVAEDHDDALNESVVAEMQSIYDSWPVGKFTVSAEEMLRDYVEPKPR